MFRSLYAKLAGVLAGLFVAVGLAFLAVVLVSTGMYEQEINQKLNRDLAKHIAAEQLLIRDQRIDQEALEKIFHMLMVTNPSIEIYLLDVEGRILAYSADPGKVKRTRVDLAPLRRLLDKDPALPVLGDDPRNLDRRKVFTAAPVRRGGVLEGFVYVILGGEEYDSVVGKLKGSHILRLSAWVIVGSLLFAITAGLVLFRLITRRLRQLTAQVEDFQRSDLTAPQDVPQSHAVAIPDELDRLRETFQNMARRIGNQVAELKEADNLRRELVANVSHDLRTPLATLQGYIETLMMKDDSVAPEQRREYLRIAIRHCERLSVLVAELFELAKLDSRETPISREAFNLGELVQDVTQKFDLSARDKRIEILTNVGRELPFVHADIGLVERVLENLIENALRHTPEEGSVSIVLAEQGDDVAVEVSDTGTGIPEKEVPRIFERFYRLDKSRSTGGGYSGLGLSIAKRILELHGRSIDVQSVVNEGTIFSFRLPVARPAAPPLTP